jgi:hypothetical protein
MTGQAYKPPRDPWWVWAISAVAVAAVFLAVRWALLTYVFS